MDTTQKKMLEEVNALQSKYSPEELRLLGSILLMADADEAEVEGHMMQNSSVYDAARLHQQDLIREAQAYRLEKEATRGQLSLAAQIGQAVGNLLVTAGRRLQGRRPLARPARSVGD